MDERENKRKNILKEAVATYQVIDLSEEELYHNTLSLLKLYSKVHWSINMAIDEMNDAHYYFDNRGIQDIVDYVADVDPRIKVERIKDRMQSIEHSRSIIDFLNLSVEKLRNYPKAGELYYALIQKSYINKTDKAIEDLAEEYNLSRATLFREKKRAITVLSIILWGYIFS